jgi:hypothetical protein
MAALLSFLSFCAGRLLPCSLRPAISNSFSTALEVYSNGYARTDDLLRSRKGGRGVEEPPSRFIKGWLDWSLALAGRQLCCPFIVSIFSLLLQ